MMTIDNYALVNRQTSIVERIVYWDGISDLHINDYEGQLIGRYDLIKITDQEVGSWFWDESSQTWSMIYRSGELPVVGFVWDGSRFTNPNPQPSLTPTNSSTSGTVPF